VARIDMYKISLDGIIFRPLALRTVKPQEASSKVPTSELPLGRECIRWRLIAVTILAFISIWAHFDFLDNK
jgi:hypothetical protein